MEQEIISTICPLCLEREGHLGSCFSCSGKGFKILLGEEKVACNRCNGTGTCIHPCNLCMEFGNPLRQPLRCQYCYISKAGNSFRVEGSDAEEVEKVARSLLREEKRLEIQSKITEARIREFQTFSEAIYENNLDVKSDSREFNPLKLFISYSRIDRRFLTRLKAHLEPLQQNGLIQVWCDQEIKAGSNREEVISEHLNPTGYATRCKQTSKEMRSMSLRPVVRTKGREGERREKRKGERSCLAKSVSHRKLVCENGQTDPLDGGIQVKDERRRTCAVSSSGPQTQSLGKRGGDPIDGNLDGRGAGWSRIACESLLPRHPPMRSLST